MPLPVNPDDRQELAQKTLLLLCAVALNALELFIPRLPFFPWLKPGLANIVTIIWIMRYGTADALVYTLVRSWIAGCYFGFSLVSLSLSLSGGVLSTLVMGALWNAFGKRGWMGLVGIGVAGALFHNLGQLLAVYVLMTSNTRIFYQFPVMALASVLFGGIVGALVLPAMRMLDRQDGARDKVGISPPSQDRSVTLFELAATLFLFGFSFSLVFITSTIVLSVAAMVTAVAVLAAFRGKAILLIRPILRFWALFLFIALMYLVLPYGTRIERITFLTYESIDSTLQQWLRLWVWLELSFLLTKYRFHIVLFAALTRLFRHQEVTFSAGLLAFEYFPLIMEVGRKRGKGFFRNLARHPVRSIQTGIEGVNNEIVEKMREGAGKG